MLMGGAGRRAGGQLSQLKDGGAVALTEFENSRLSLLAAEIPPTWSPGAAVCNALPGRTDH
jgi:hypothetical protein